MKRLLFAAALLGLAAGASGADRPCTPVEQKAAEKAVDLVVNWEQLYKAYKDYGHCDQGEVAALYTEALLRCIVEWKNVERLARPMDEDKQYRAFVYRHLDDPAAKADLEAIHSRAKMSCPRGLEGFCAELVSAVKPFQPLQMPAPAAKPAAPVEKK